MIEEKLKQKLKILDQNKLDLQFLNACKDNNLELIDYLLFSEDLVLHSNIASKNYQGLRDSANKGFYDIIHYLLTDPRIKNNTELIRVRKQVLIRNSCRSGNLKLVKFLLETPGIKEYIDFSINNYKSFEEAIYSFNPDLVFYLNDKYKSVTIYNHFRVFFSKIYKENYLDYSKKLIEDKNIKEIFIISEKSTVLSEFLIQNNKEAIEYLFSIPEIKKKLITYIDYGNVMVSMSKTNIDILGFIIAEHNIPLTNLLKDFLSNPVYNTENMRKIFENRELYKKLNDKLLEIKTKQKNKIWFNLLII